MQYTVESVQNVLQTFYGSSGDPNNMGLAQDWLIQFQKSNSVWSIAPNLLHYSIVEIQYFGASTIEGKIKSDWINMSNELRQQVLEQLLNILRSENNSNSNNNSNNSNNNNNNNNNNANNSNNGSGLFQLHKMVVTRLCLAVAAIACHSTPEIWQNPIQDILQIAFPDLTDLDRFDSNRIIMVLELLTILPDELLNCDYITQERRNRVGIEFNKSIELIMRVISRLMKIQQQNSHHIPLNTLQNILKNTLRCFKSWILFDTPASYFLTSASSGPTQYNSLLSDCFDAVIKDAQLVEDFVLVLDEIFTFMRGKHFKQYPSSFDPVVGRILDVFPHYYLMAQQEENERIENSIFLLFSHIPETHSKILLSSKYNERFMSILIELAKRGNIDICDLMEPVISEVHTLFDNGTDISVWNQFLCDSIELLRLKCMFPIEDEMDSIEMENFTRFRTVAGDSLLNIYSILEAKTLQMLLSSLWNDINKFPNTTWQSIESTVFLLGCLSEGITDDISFIPQLFQLLGSLPIQSTPLVKSTIVLAGKYANLLEKSTQFLIKLVGDFIPAFSNPELSSVASESFLSISRNKNCALLLSTDISTLVKVCEPIISQDNESSRKILEALLEIVAVLPPEDTLNYISPLISPYLHFLKQYNPQAKNSKPTLLNTISILSKLCKIFEMEEYEMSAEKESKYIHPILPIVVAILPITGNILKIQKNDVDIVDYISLLYKRITISCSKNYEQFLPTIFIQLTEIYEVSPLAQILNTLSVGIPSLSPNQRYDFLSHTINTVSATTFQIWKNGNADRVGAVHTNTLYNLSIIPEITKGYFSLLQQCITYNILSFPINLLMPLFQVLLENILNIQDKPTIRPVSSFISTLLSLEQKNNQPNYLNFKTELDRLLSQHGENMINQVLYAVGGGSPRSIVSYIGEIILAFINNYPNIFRPIAQRMLAVEGFPSSNITASQKEKFLANLMRYKSKQAIFRKTIAEFSLICFGLDTVNDK